MREVLGPRCGASGRLGFRLHLEETPCSLPVPVPHTARGITRNALEDLGSVGTLEVLSGVSGSVWGFLREKLCRGERE